MEHAQKTLDDLIATREEVKCKVEVGKRPHLSASFFVSFIGSLELHTRLLSINQWSGSSAQEAHRCHLVLINLMLHRCIRTMSLIAGTGPG